MDVIDEKKASVLRRYFVEVVVMALVAAVTILVYGYNDLQKFIRTDLVNMRIKNEVLIESNTRALNDNTATLQEIRAVIRSKK